MVLSLMSAFVVLLPTQAPPTPESGRPGRVQTITFEGPDLISGGLVEPEGQLVTTRPKPHFDRMLRVRADFNDKLMASASEL